MKVCPFCASENIFFSKKRNRFYCEDCEHGFDLPLESNGLRIFISYGHDKNIEVVMKIKEYLNNNGYNVWIDSKDITPGGNWREKITNGIIGSNVVLFFLSKHSVANPGVCLEELKIALSLKHSYVKTVLLEDETKVSIPRFIKDIQWVDMSDWENIKDVDWDSYFKNKMSLLTNALQNEDIISHNEELEKIKAKLNVNINIYKEQSLLKHSFVGREWLKDKINEWSHNDKNEPYIIFGVPGSGKSAFCVHYSYNNPEVMALISFNWNDKENQSIDKIIKLCAFKLADVLPDYRKILYNSIIKPDFENQVKDYNNSDLFNLLLLNPLHCCIDGERETGIIIFDGLDETSNEMKEILLTRSVLFPKWIKILFSSREDVTIAPCFKNNNQVTLDEKHNDNYNDILLYVADRLDLSINNSIVIDLANKSEGSFMYAVSFCDAYTDGNMTIDDVKTLPSGLNKFYYELFKRLFKNKNDYGFIKPILELLCTDEDIPENIIKLCLNLDNYELWELRLDVKNLITNSEHNSEYNKNKYRTLKFVHQSIKDWLINPEYAGEYLIDVTNGYKRLSRYYDILTYIENLKLPLIDVKKYLLQKFSEDSNNIYANNKFISWFNKNYNNINEYLNSEERFLTRSNNIKWLILGKEYAKAEELLLNSFDSNEFSKNIDLSNYTQYYDLFSLWLHVDLFSKDYNVNILIEKLNEIVKYPLKYMASSFSHRSIQISLFLLRHIMDTDRFRESLYKIFEKASLAGYFLSRASDDCETRDGWDKYCMTRDAVICLKKIEKNGFIVPTNIKDNIEKMKLTYNSYEGNVNGGMFHDGEHDKFLYGILAEEELFKDICVISNLEDKIGSVSCIELVKQYNTTSLRYYLANSTEIDKYYIRNCISNYADLNIACDKSLYDINNMISRKEYNKMTHEDYLKRINFIKKLKTYNNI